MKQKTNTMNLSSNTQLWKELPVTETHKALKACKKDSTFTNFLKNIYSYQDSHKSVTSSEVLSIMDIKYSESLSEPDFKEKKYFINQLIKATWQIWSQIRCQLLNLQKFMRSNFKELITNFSKLIDEKTSEIKSLIQNVKELEVQNSSLWSELRTKEQLLKKQQISSQQLSQTNKQLRTYLKNMNEIMMKYHQKNIQLQEYTSQLEKKYETALDKSFEQKDYDFLKSTQTFSSTYLRKNFVQLSNRKSQLEDEEQETHNEFKGHLSVEFNRKFAKSPTYEARKRFHRKNNFQSPDSSTVRYIPKNRISFKQNQQLFHQSLSRQQTQGVTLNKDKNDDKKINKK